MEGGGGGVNFSQKEKLPAFVYLCVYVRRGGETQTLLKVNKTGFQFKTVFRF